ncbi:hypothetical protein Neosp_001841 [[Neocosmospora] mangrovei]
MSIYAEGSSSRDCLVGIKLSYRYSDVGSPLCHGNAGLGTDHFLVDFGDVGAEPAITSSPFQSSRSYSFGIFMAALAAAQRSSLTRLLEDDLRIREVSDSVFEISQVVVHSVCDVQNG